MRKEDRKVKGFQILLFDWSFSSDILAVKRLTLKDSSIRSIWTYLKARERERERERELGLENYNI